MSVEQWVVIALFILLPLLEGVARLRRTRVSDDRPSDRVAQAPPAARGAPLSNRPVSDSVMGAAETSAISPPPSLPPSLPQPASDAAVALAPLRASQTRVSSRGSGSFEAQRRVQRPVCGDALVQWLRPVRNLRRAIVVATILGPPIDALQGEVARLREHLRQGKPSVPVVSQRGSDRDNAGATSARLSRVG
jgi:hypothetical protein